jgi:hypothetical protein
MKATTLHLENANEELHCITEAEESVKKITRSMEWPSSNRAKLTPFSTLWSTISTPLRRSAPRPLGQ